MSTAATAVTAPPPLGQALPLTFYTTMTAALATVAALTWSDAFKTLFAARGVFAKHAAAGPWVVAVLATVLAVLGTRALYRLNTVVVDKIQ
jgi:hypothetical protein